MEWDKEFDDEEFSFSIHKYKPSYGYFGKEYQRCIYCGVCKKENKTDYISKAEQDLDTYIDEIQELLCQCIQHTPEHIYGTIINPKLMTKLFELINELHRKVGHGIVSDMAGLMQQNDNNKLSLILAMSQMNKTAEEEKND